MILWLTSKKGFSPATKGMLSGFLARNGLPTGSIIFYSLYNKVPNLDVYTKKKNGVCRPQNLTAARHALSQQIEGLQPKLIVCNDEASLRAITDQPYTLATTRGSVYQFSGLPVLVLDDVHKLQFDPVSKFVTQLDFGKLVRYALGRQKKHPSFTYTLATSVAEVEAHASRAKNASLLAIDTETASKFITVVSYTYDYNGALFTFAVPFFDPLRGDAAYWSADDEFKIRAILRELHASPVVKALQNGAYDCAYFIKEQMPLTNFFVNTDELMHCIWIEVPKALHNLASYWCDDYVYWKDDGKGVKEEGFGHTRDTLLKYWRYCGLDTYWTWLVAYELLPKLVSQKWAIDNYKMEFPLQVGPCLESTLTGIAIDRDAHAHIMQQQQVAYLNGIEDIRRLTGEKEFNIKSPRHVAWFLYDFCRQQPTRLQWTDPTRRGRKKYGPRSTDEKVLKIMKEQNNGLSCIARNFIDRLLRAKKPGNVLSNYQELNFITMRNRFCTWLNAAGTDTFRFASGSNPFWIGRNSQNIPGWLREWLVADRDWVLLSADYSASDDRFIAYESEDPAKMELVESGKDPHCFHASVFFGKPYEEIVKGWKAKDPAIIHPTYGIRQNTKRVTHGRNFRMEAGTMYNTMGRDAVVATAVSLGHPTAARWNDKDLIGINNILIDKYDHPQTGLYKRLRKWWDETADECIANKNRMTNTFGLTRWFLGDMKNHDTQRELASCYGQMGTAGNINRALKEIYYGGTADARCRFLQQGHDSLLFLIHRSVLHEKVAQIIAIMEDQFVIHGRSIRIPVDAKLGLRWSEDMVGYKSDVTYEQIVEFDRETFAKKYPRRDNASALIEALGNMDFSQQSDTSLAAEAGSQFENELEKTETSELELAD